MSPFSLYLHIPFCVHKCPYCDFNTYAVSRIPEKEYVAALLAELDYRASQPAWQGRTIQTVFFGGGTPSLFGVAAIKRIMLAISNTFPLAESLEVSLEANPGNITEETLAGYRDAGVNRLSLGAQSLNPETLKTLGRQHTPEQVEAALASARGAGFRNINIDIMYGVPGQRLDDLENDMRMADSLGPSHISAYGLTIEKGTPFFQSVKRGVMKLPPEDLTVEMMESINHFLPAYGYERYEISNFAKPGKEARHNLAYWNGDDYLGLGAGAHSYRRREEGDDTPRRWSNFALPQRYIDQTTATGHAESWSEALSPEAELFELVFLGLRKIRGVSLEEFTTRFGATVQELYGSRLKMLLEQGVVCLEDGFLKLSEKGLLLADSVIEDFAQAEALVQRCAPIVEESEAPKAANGY